MSTGYLCVLYSVFMRIHGRARFVRDAYYAVLLPKPSFKAILNLRVVQNIKIALPKGGYSDNVIGLNVGTTGHPLCNLFF